MTRVWQVAPALTALGGALFGFLLSSSLAVTPSTQDRGSLELGDSRSEVRIDLEPLLFEVRALGDRIADLAGARVDSSGASQASSAREPVAGIGQATTSEVAQLLARCTTLLERLERRERGSDRGELNLNVEGTSRDTLAALDFTTKDLAKQLTKEHILWTYQQVLDRYGPPDEIYNPQNKTSVVWSYWLKMRNGDTERVAFFFIEGFVSRVDD